jgi:hypothetical protein
MMGQRRIRVQLNRQAQFAHCLLLPVHEKKSLAEVAMLIGAEGILQNGEPEFHYRRFIVTLGQERPSQTTMTTLPTGIHPEQFAKFGDCGLVIGFVAIAVAQIVADNGFFRRQTLGVQVFGNCHIEASQVV